MKINNDIKELRFMVKEAKKEETHADSIVLDLLQEKKEKSLFRSIRQSIGLGLSKTGQIIQPK